MVVVDLQTVLAVWLLARPIWNHFGRSITRDSRRRLTLSGCMNPPLDSMPPSCSWLPEI